MRGVKEFLSHYRFVTILVASLGLGTVTGLVFQERAGALKPLGDIFLNLLFTAVVPLVFFSISSAVAGMRSVRRLGRILGTMMAVFIVTGIIASVLMLVGVKVFPPAEGIRVALTAPSQPEQVHWGNQLVQALTASDFHHLLSKNNMLALIVFSLLVGLASLSAGEVARPFVRFLQAGNAVMAQVIRYIMFYAPVGLFGYFAYLTGIFGPTLMGSYLRAVTLYYPLAAFYFAAAFSAYAGFAGGVDGVCRFWRNIIPAALTALGTGSSVATIPLNMEAARKTGVPEDIREVIIPIGATIHMDGSCLSAVLKIAVLFGLFGMDFSGAGTLAAAVGIALLSGTVMSGIPGGGFIGELMIVTLYGFPPEALAVISVVGALVDPPATAVNAVGDNVSCMVVARLLEGKRWRTERDEDD